PPSSVADTCFRTGRYLSGENEQHFISCSYSVPTIYSRGRSALDKYLLVPLEDTVVFPNMTVNLPLDLGGETHVLLVPRHQGEYANVGTIAEVDEIGRLPGGGVVVTLTGRTRGLLGAAETAPDGRLFVEVEERPDVTPPPVKTRELETEYRAIVEEILELRRANRSIGEFLRSITEPGALADTCAYAPDLTFEQRVEL